MSDMDFDDPDEPVLPIRTQVSDQDHPFGPLPPVNRGKWGWYELPRPGTRHNVLWQRTTTLIDMVGSKYHLELWKQRNVAKGIAIRPALSARAAMLDIQEDKDEFNKLVEKALDAAGATAAADLGTAMHSMSEVLDHTGSMEPVPEAFRPRLEEYHAKLRELGISVVPGCIERQIVSEKYQAGGQLDRIFRLSDGSCVIGDLKTVKSLDFDFAKVEAQLAVYEDGVNTGGIWTVDGWNTSIKVRRDIGLIVHLPSDRPGCEVYIANLESGRRRLEACMQVRDEQKRKSPMQAYRPEEFVSVLSDLAAPDGWEERLYAANSHEELVAVAEAARAVGQWGQSLADIARRLSVQLRSVSPTG